MTQLQQNIKTNKKESSAADVKTLPGKRVPLYPDWSRSNIHREKEPRQSVHQLGGKSLPFLTLYEKGKVSTPFETLENLIS